MHAWRSHDRKGWRPLLDNNGGQEKVCDGNFALLQSRKANCVRVCVREHARDFTCFGHTDLNQSLSLPINSESFQSIAQLVKCIVCPFIPSFFPHVCCFPQITGFSTTHLKSAVSVARATSPTLRWCLNWICSVFVVGFFFLACIFLFNS